MKIKKKSNQRILIYGQVKIKKMLKKVNNVNVE